jgi:bifunctional UDP-N-acetylglucosamine pyrophosphorylase/glucosamine-1-phosphate N-acetyltransferase
MTAVDMTAAPIQPAATAAPQAIVMAAGKGTRMKSDLPKVVHPVGGRPMICAVVRACLDAGCSRVVLVVGYQQERVREAIAGQMDFRGANIEFAVQAEQLGTGHAVMAAAPLFPQANPSTASTAPKLDLFVLAGDGPLIRPETLRVLLSQHRSTTARATLATSVIDDPTGYGRIVRDATGHFGSIVEHKDATPDERRIREINPSYYCFDALSLFNALRDVKRNPSSHEYYITDVPALLLARGERVDVVDAVPPEDVLSINTPEELARVDAIYRARRAARSAASQGGTR